MQGTLLNIWLGCVVWLARVIKKNAGGLEAQARHPRGGTDVRRAMIAGISPCISNPNPIASELKFSNPALASAPVDNASYVEPSAAGIEARA